MRAAAAKRDGTEKNSCETYEGKTQEGFIIIHLFFFFNQIRTSK